MNKEEWIEEAKRESERFLDLGDEYFENLYKKYSDKTPLEAIRADYAEHD